jgi:transposase
VPVLFLYDVTSTYFEGTKAEDGEYGYQRDKRWDRYQIVVGLVCNEQGIPLAVEVWPGNTADKATVATQVKLLKEQFGIEKAVFVGDKGMYSETNIDQIVEAGFGYIIGLDWNKQRKQLEALAPVQLGLLDQIGIVEWEADGVRYVGCSSELNRERAARRRETGLVKAQQELEKLARTAAKGAYYSWVSLRERINEVLKANWVQGLWEVVIAPLEKMGSPEDKIRLQVTFTVDEDAVARRKIIEGKYVLQTSLSSKQYPPKQVDKVYRYLQKVERSFRHIKSYLNIRPIYHYKRRRVRAHVLICFLAYYLVKKMELELRARGETREVEPLLRTWEQLRLCELRFKVGEYSRREWHWSLGEVGEAIKSEISGIGWWRSLEAHRHSLIKSDSP